VSPFWSPDGRSIGFFSGGFLKRVSLDGGSPKTLCPVTGNGWNGTWAPDGTILFADWGARRMMRISDDGGEPVVVNTGTMPFGWPHFLPDGRHFLFNHINLNEGSIESFMGSLDSADVRPIGGVASKMEYVAGRLVFWRDGTLLAQPFDVAQARLTGTPTTLADHVHGFSITGFAAFSAASAQLVYQSGVSAQPLQWIDRQGRPLGSVGPEADAISLRLSPDGRRVALGTRDQDLGTNDVFILDLDRNAATRLTNDRRTENSPVWTPDGQTLVYAADRTGAPSLFARAANGTGGERPILPPVAGGPQRPSSISPDGTFVVFVRSEPGTATDVLMVPMDGSGVVTPLVQTKAREGQPQLSADGSWLAYVSDESGRSEVYVQRLRDASTRRQVSQDGGSAPLWRGDGREIFFLAAGRDRIMAADLNLTSTTAVPAVPHMLYAASRRLADYDVTPDGQKFLLAPDAPREAGSLSAVLHWMSLLR